MFSQGSLGDCINKPYREVGKGEDNKERNESGTGHDYVLRFLKSIIFR